MKMKGATNVANDKQTMKNLEDRNINFRDFSSDNPHFGIRLDEETANDLAERGWPVKYSKTPDSEGICHPYINVLVRFQNPRKQPNIFTITNKKKTSKDKDTVKDLDKFFFERVDVILEKGWVERYQCWSIYLVTGLFYIDEDELMASIADIPDDGFYEEEDDIPFN